LPFGQSKEKVRKEIEKRMSHIDKSSESAAVSKYMNLIEFIIKMEGGKKKRN